ncbi:MAG: SDR family NAD(P)-dependent oxidoreductase [Janthinobacterium lividum]
MELSGKCAVVIGGTSGIGKALALGLAEAGADVVASSRSKEACAAIAAEIEAVGRRSLTQTSDVQDRTSLERLRDVVLEHFGKVDVLVNCAGRTQRVPTLDCPEELWNSILDTNLTGTLRGCQIFGRGMIERGHGRIINIASLSTFVAFQEVAPYGCSKAAVGALTQSLAVEWARHGVLVNAIAPGIFPTALNTALLDSPRGQELKLRTPMARFGAASELVSTAIHLASDRTSFTTGQILVVDGGFLASGVNQ